MAITELGEPVKLGKGAIMTFKADDAVAATDKFHQWSETSYDGQPGSYCPSVPPHWHEFHDEYMGIIEGAIKFSLNGKEVVFKAGDDTVRVPKTHVHGFTFIEGVKTTLKEYTDPVGDYKEAFFRDLAQLATDKGPSFWMAVRAFHEGDAFVSLPGGFQTVDKAVTGLLGFAASWFMPVKRPLSQARSGVGTT